MASLTLTGKKSKAKAKGKRLGLERCGVMIGTREVTIVLYIYIYISAVNVHKRGRSSRIDSLYLLLSERGNFTRLPTTVLYQSGDARCIATCRTH